MVTIPEVVGRLNERFGLDLDPKAYSGMWCHRLPDADQVAVEKTGHQSHIAVTGDSMLLFPVVTSVEYEREPQSAAAEKARYVLRVDVKLFRENLLALLDRATHFDNAKMTVVMLKAAAAQFQSGPETVESHTECRFNIRNTGQRQMQIGHLGPDDDTFTRLRQTLKPGDYLVLLMRDAAQFDVLGLPSEDVAGNWETTVVPPVGLNRAVTGKNVSGPTATALPTGDRVLDLLANRRNVVLYGPPGTGKTHHALRVAVSWEGTFGEDSVFRVTFHPSYSYEDFIQGYRPREDDPAKFERQAGILLEAVGRAENLLKESPVRDVLLLIDEINRADVARVFGELITYIEPDKRGVSVRLAQDPKHTIEIPPNLAILGTMNTADKSVSLLDIALRRRFAFVEFRPDPGAFDTVLQWRFEVGGLRIGDLMMELNRRLAAAGISDDRALGQALLAVDEGVSDPVTALSDRLELDVFPLIEEYCYFDRRRLKEILGPLVTDSGRWDPPPSTELIGALRQMVDPTEGVVAAESSTDDASEESRY